MKLLRHCVQISVAIAAAFSCAGARAACWDAAGQRYGVDPLLLQAIAWKESRGWTHAVGPKLPDGNRALGLMQINTIHLPALAKFGIGREHLFDACTSQNVGAWVLADCMAKFGSTWKAVGCYYAGPASRNVKAQAEYVADVQRFYEGYRLATTKAATGARTASVRHDRLAASTPVVRAAAGAAPRFIALQGQ